MKTRVYIKLHVYNYDASPRHQWIEHDCKSVEHARRLEERINKLIGWGKHIDQNSTGRWLERHHGIYGFIEEVGGIYEETTRRIA